jgi:N-acetylmuramoyl-L-alanine amidase
MGMLERGPVTRRVLLGRAVSGAAVIGTFLLPGGFGAAGAERHRHISGSGRSRAPAPHTPAPLVMLDPGHGGKDPGAIGVSGTYEKHVSLAVAEELRRLLEAGGRYRVTMTRQTDVFVPLEERVARAQEHGAGLFVSMHADALGDHAVRGASVYTLSTGASDALSAQLAARENSADRFLGPRYRAVSPEVARILASLVQRETRVDSLRFAHSMVGCLDRDLPMLPHPERHAGFVVLKSADIPSVLVEMGFMSNPRDEAELRRPAHRALVAQAMRQAVDAYFAAGARIAGHAPENAA